MLLFNASNPLLRIQSWQPFQGAFRLINLARVWMDGCSRGQGLLHWSRVLKSCKHAHIQQGYKDTQGYRDTRMGDGGLKWGSKLSKINVERRGLRLFSTAVLATERAPKPKDNRWQWQWLTGYIHTHTPAHTRGKETIHMRESEYICRKSERAALAIALTRPECVCVWIIEYQFSVCATLRDIFD